LGSLSRYPSLGSQAQCGLPVRKEWLFFAGENGVQVRKVNGKTGPLAESNQRLSKGFGPSFETEFGERCELLLAMGTGGNRSDRVCAQKRTNLSDNSADSLDEDPVEP
jgi:hypothetical protein